MNLGKSASNIDRIMGLFYAGGTVTSRKQTKTIGSITGRQLCFGHADPDACGEDPSPPGGQVPSFFQVIPDANNLVTTITSGGQFTVVSYQRYWVECKRTPGITPAWETSHELCDYTR